MSTTGTVVNGRIELDEPEFFPEGTKVWIGSRDEAIEKLDEDSPIPPLDETYEQHLAILRQSVEDAKAGKGRPWREVLQELSLKHDLPPLPEE